MAAPPSDPRLPQLARALEARGMAASFEAWLARELPHARISIASCTIERLYHKPGKACRITYRLEGQLDGQPFWRWLVGQLLPPGGDPGDAVDGAPARWPGCAPFRPVAFWDELSMQVQAFPYDVELRGLDVLCDPDAVRPRLQDCAAKREPAGSPRCVDVRVTPVKYRPQRSCVLRYDATLRDAGGCESNLVVFGKTYPPGGSAVVFDAISELYASFRSTGAAIPVPRPLAHLESWNTLWLEGFPGEGARELALRRGFDVALAPARMEACAHLLAALHAVELRGRELPAGPTVAELVEDTEGDVADILRFEPGCREELEAIRRLLVRSVPDPAEARAATLHGTFKLAQLLYRNDGVGVVDFDSISRGDPHYDLGEFCASLVSLELRDGLSPETTERAIDCFLGAYGERSNRPCRRPAVAWYTAFFLLGKLHSALKKHRAHGRHPGRAVARLAEWTARAAVGPGGAGPAPA